MTFPLRAPVHGKAPSAMGGNRDFGVRGIEDLECDEGVVKSEDILRSSVWTLGHVFAEPVV